MHCREILCTPRCSPRAREFPRSVNFSLRRTVAELRGVKIAQFSYFGLFSPIQNPENVPSAVSSYTAQGLHLRVITISPCDSRRSNGVPSCSAVFLRLLVGELGTFKLAHSFAYGKCLYPYRILQRGASDLDQRCLKTCNSKDGCTFAPNIFASIPKIITKPHFGGPLSADPEATALRRYTNLIIIIIIIERAVRRMIMDPRS